MTTITINTVVITGITFTCDSDEGHSVVMKPLRPYKHCGVVKSLGADCEL